VNGKYVGFLGRPSGRIAVVRLLPGTDLLEGIEKVCSDFHIKYGICWCHGSLTKATLYVPGQGGLPKMRLYEKTDTGQLLSAMGVICETSEGKKDIHMHMVLNNELDHELCGGHAVPGKCLVFDTMDLIVMEIEGGKMLRKLDEQTGEIEFAPQADKTRIRRRKA
jgi:uncharacterized protein